MRYKELLFMEISKPIALVYSLQKKNLQEPVYSLGASNIWVTTKIILSIHRAAGGDCFCCSV